MERFNTYYDDYYSLVYSIAYSITRNKEMSEDILQDVYVKLYIHLKYAKDIHMVKEWLCRTTKNQALDYLKKWSRYRFYGDTEQIIARDMIADIHNKFFTKNILSDLEQHNKSWYMIVEMHYILGMKISEIANELNCTEDSVKSTLKRAMKYLSNKHRHSGELLIILFTIYLN